MGGTGILRTGEGGCLAVARRCVWPFAVDQALFGQVAENLLGTGDALFASGVGHAPQFDGGCHAGQGNVGLGEAFGQL
ncbi:hypothetical protein D3C71_2130950 [compost metagenome]